MALPSAQGVSGTLRTPGPGSLSAVTGLGGWESQLYAGACKATWGPGQLWHMQGTAVRPDPFSSLSWKSQGLMQYTLATN